MNEAVLCHPPMSEEQLMALLAKLKLDSELQARLKDAEDLEAAVSIAKEAGFDVSKEEIIKHQAEANPALSEQDLDVVVGGNQWSACGSNHCRGNTAGSDCCSN